MVDCDICSSHWRALIRRGRCGHGATEVSLYVNDAFLARHNKPARARLRGLAKNPAVPGALLRRLVDEYSDEIGTLEFRRHWSDDQFDALVDHPDPDVRVQLAKARHARPEQLAKLVEDSSFDVLMALASGPTPLDLPIAEHEPRLPLSAYERLIERDTRLREAIARSRWAPQDLRRQRSPWTKAPAGEPQFTRREAEELSRRSEWGREVAARYSKLPADLVEKLAADRAPAVRLAVSMHPSLTEEQRAAIDYRVAPEDRIKPARWAMTTTDPQQLRQCVYSAHIGLRRSVAYNKSLSPDLVAVLAADDDFAVRLLVCENHADVPGEVVLATFLEARTLSCGLLLNHPAMPRVGLARLAGSPDPSARSLVARDPDAPPELLEQLSYDPHPAVRMSMARDQRLSPSRVLELFDDPWTTEPAAANPHLPVHFMERILADAAALADEQIEGQPTVYLGNWKPGELPPEG